MFLLLHLVIIFMSLMVWLVLLVLWKQVDYLVLHLFFQIKTLLHLILRILLKSMPCHLKKEKVISNLEIGRRRKTRRNQIHPRKKNHLILPVLFRNLITLAWYVMRRILRKIFLITQKSQSFLIILPHMQRWKILFWTRKHIWFLWILLLVRKCLCYLLRSLKLMFWCRYEVKIKVINFHHPMVKLQINLTLQLRPHLTQIYYLSFKS